MIYLIFAWLLAGIGTTAITLLGGLHSSWVSLLAVLPVVAVTSVIVVCFKRISSLSFFEKGSVVLLAGIWLIHAVGLVTPEVGFDAVWYHLPVLHLMIKAGGLTYHPEWYQTLNPVFSDLLFSWGFVVFGEFGAKLTAYALAISWLVIVYGLFRFFLPRNWSLAAVCIVSLFQPVAWQASSFYVDIARSFWEVSALYLLLQYRKTSMGWMIYVAGLCIGAALASKLFVIALLPFWLVVAFFLSPKSKVKNTFSFCVCSVLVALPFWLHTTRYGGTPWYPLAVGSSALSVIGGEASWPEYLMQRTIRLWWAPWYLSIARDYITPLLTWCLPLLGVVAWRYRQSMFGWTFWQTRMSLLVLAAIALGEMITWWYLPPLSSRYALTGFVCIWILEVVAVRAILLRMKGQAVTHFATLVVAVWLGGAVFGLLPRMAVAAKTVLWVSKGGSREEYYQPIRDGWIDGHLDKWNEMYRKL